MINNEKVGVGIVTYNRKNSFRSLYDRIIKNNNVDSVVVVKNKDINYEESDPENLVDNQRSFYYHIKDDLGVGFCKNTAIKHLLIKEQCTHIFLIEDDINIKNDDVFSIYINTAKEFNLEHLNFSMAWDSITQQYLKQQYIIQKNNYALGISNRLCGDFSYFTANSLLHVGLFDAKHYINAMEHIEHTYRVAIDGYTTPFYAFADVANSIDLIEDTGITSTVQENRELYNSRIAFALQCFKAKYNRTLNTISYPTPPQIQQFLMSLNK